MLSHPLFQGGYQMWKSVVFPHPVPKLLVLNKSQKKCSYRTLWCHREVDLWPLELKKKKIITFHPIRHLCKVWLKSVHEVLSYRPSDCDITVIFDCEIQKKFSQGFTEILNLKHKVSWSPSAHLCRIWGNSLSVFRRYRAHKNGNDGRPDVGTPAGGHCEQRQIIQITW